jgi:hypothetical protein
LHSADIRVIKTPVRTPVANACAERWVRTVRRECLDRILILGAGHLARVLDEYVEHYNEHRPHRSLDQRPPEAHDTPLARHHTFPPSIIRRRDVLGGLIHEYRAAA